MADACPLGLAYSTSALQKFASPALGELDEQDLAEVASLLRRSQRPANRAFLAALCSTSAPSSFPTGLDADDAGEVHTLLAHAARPASVAFLSSLLAAAPPSSASELEAAELEADRNEVSRLLPLCSRPRNRGVLQLVAAGLSADSHRATSGSAPAPVTADTPEAAADAPEAAAAVTAAVDTESAVLVVHAAEHAAAAHEIAQIVCGHAGTATLPPPLHRALSHVWRVKNRYYKAALQLLTLEDDAPAARAAITALAQESQALVLLFELADPTSWRALLQRWEGMLVSGAVAPEILLLVGLGPNGGAAATAPAAAAAAEAAAAAALEWSLDHGAEFVRVELRAVDEVAEARVMAAASRGEGAAPPTSGEAEGLARLVEALQCRVWPPAADEDEGAAQQASRQRGEAERQLLASCSSAAATGGGGGGGAGCGAAASDAASAEQAAPEQAGPEEAGRLATAERYIERLASEEEGAAVTPVEVPAEEREQDRTELLIEKMAQLRDRGDEMDPAERRRQAEKVALELSAMLGEGDGDESSSDDES